MPLLVSTAGRGGPIGSPGTVLGVVARPTLHDTTVELHPGDVALFFTDGVTGGRRGGELYDDERLLRTLTRAAARGRRHHRRADRRRGGRLPGRAAPGRHRARRLRVPD